MNTAWHILSPARGLKAALVALALLCLTTGCQKKCQQPATQRFKSLRETPWRLVDTNNPAQEYRNLSRFTFLITEFSVNFKGDVKKVVNNDQFDTPILTFLYNVDPDGKFLVLKYSSLDAGSDGTGTDGGGTTTDVGTVKYTYELSNELNLYEVNRPYHYRYIPFQGVVDPDSTCVF